MSEFQNHPIEWQKEKDDVYSGKIWNTQYTSDFDLRSSFSKNAAVEILNMMAKIESFGYQVDRIVFSGNSIMVYNDSYGVVCYKCPECRSIYLASFPFYPDQVEKHPDNGCNLGAIVQVLSE